MPFALIPTSLRLFEPTKALDVRFRTTRTLRRRSPRRARPLAQSCGTMAKIRQMAAPNAVANQDFGLNTLKLFARSLERPTPRPEKDALKGPHKGNFDAKTAESDPLGLVLGRHFTAMEALPGRANCGGRAPEPAALGARGVVISLPHAPETDRLMRKFRGEDCA